jgi:Domain of Unknown Function (DUF1080)
MERRKFLAMGLATTAGLDLFPMAAPPESKDGVDVPLAPPPPFATVLFNGKDLTGWVSREGGPARWSVKDGYMEVVPKTGDIYTRGNFADFQLHLEFWLPYMPEAKGQARANSGVYLQGRYEVQVLDSYGLKLKNDDCGAIYKYATPLRNASKKPQVWQGYDIALRTPRFDENGQLKEKGRLTVFHNGIMIHNNLELNGPSGGALSNDQSKPGPILLQDHGNLVRYRNIWIIPT